MRSKTGILFFLVILFIFKGIVAQDTIQFGCYREKQNIENYLIRNEATYGDIKDVSHEQYAQNMVDYRKVERVYGFWNTRVKVIKYPLFSY